MQVEVDLKRMQTNFDGRGFSGFGVMAPFCLPSKRLKFPFRPWTIIIKTFIKKEECRVAAIKTNTNKAV